MSPTLADVAADPLARGLAVAQVVVVDRVGHPVEVVVGAAKRSRDVLSRARERAAWMTTDGEPTMGVIIRVDVTPGVTFPAHG